MSQLVTKFLQDAAVTDVKVATGINATKIGAGTVSNTAFGYISGLTSDAQTQINSKLSSSLTSAHLFVGNGSNAATDVAVSGDLTLANTGAFTIANNAVTTPKIAANAVTGAKILLANAEFLRGRNAANTADISIIEVNSSNNAQMGATLDMNNNAIMGTNDVLPFADVTNAVGSPILRYASGFFDKFYDGSAALVIDITNRLLTDSSSNPAINFATRTFIDSTNVNAMTFDSGGGPGGNRKLFDASGNIAVNFKQRTLSDSSGVESMNWDGRVLEDNAAAVALNYSQPDRIEIKPDTTGPVPRALSFRNSGDTHGSLIKANDSIAGDTLFQLPVNNGTSGQVLETDGTGITSWVTPGASATNNKETFVLNSTDITNQYVDLAHVALTNSINFLVKGAGAILEGASYDYSVNYTGGAGGHTRLTFLNGLATGGGSALVAGDVLQIQYEY